jgi:hypothetical protein
MRGARTLLLVGVAVMLVGPAPASAAAGDDASVVVERETFAAGEWDSVMVACGPGERAIGGGVESDPGAYVTASAPVSGDGTIAKTDSGEIPRFWWVAVWAPGSEIRSLEFYAVCSRSSDATLQVTSWDFFGGLGQTPEVRFATCPEGERAIGGGAGYDDAVEHASFLHAVGPLDQTGATQSTDDGDIARSWWVAMTRGLPAGTTSQAKVMVICSATSTATVQASTIEVANEDPGYYGGVTSCPAGQRAISGGLGTTGDEPPPISDTAPGTETGTMDLRDGDIPGSWRAGFTAGRFSGGTYKVFAICEGAAESESAPEPQPAPPATDPPPDTNPAEAPQCDGAPATILGSESSEAITGTPGDDVILALGGDDTIRASAGNDVVCGGQGNDKLKGGGGADLLFGEQGRDSLLGGPASDSCNGGRGRDEMTCEKERS